MPTTRSVTAALRKHKDEEAITTPSPRTENNAEPPTTEQTVTAASERADSSPPELITTEKTVLSSPELVSTILSYCDPESLWHSANTGSILLRQTALQVCINHLLQEQKTPKKNPADSFLCLFSSYDDFNGTFEATLTVKACPFMHDKRDMVDAAMAYFREVCFSPTRTYPPYSIKDDAHATSWKLNYDRMRRDFASNGIVKIKSDRGWDRLKLQLHDEGSDKTTITQTAKHWLRDSSRFEENQQRSVYIRRLVRWLLLRGVKSGSNCAHLWGLSRKEMLSALMTGPFAHMEYLFFKIESPNDSSTISLRIEFTSGRYFSKKRSRWTLPTNLQSAATGST